jgi:hypothetical protein
MPCPAALVILPMPAVLFNRPDHSLARLGADREPAAPVLPAVSWYRVGGPAGTVCVRLRLPVCATFTCTHKWSPACVEKSVLHAELGVCESNVSDVSVTRAFACVVCRCVTWRGWVLCPGRRWLVGGSVEGALVPAHSPAVCWRGVRRACSLLLISSAARIHGWHEGVTHT